MEKVHNYGIMCHCYRFQGIFDNVNEFAVCYTNMKDMVYSLALKLPVNTWFWFSEILTQCPTQYVPAEVAALQPG